ncbi:TPA: FAD-dependent oxidoreductase [Legionella pneumophila]|uniref:Na(+)-translocating NADH-quinone reductase subunit F n=2 Tax=Legionella TaxID=445 RepID=A0A1E5JL12_9GAMM|nr:MULTISPECIES: FAD-dependent oxidoreductase [Legionella]AMQ28699.1 oxidoreductase [Legionella pneumophila subsp. pneumophila]AUH70800.1 FAD-dependent oxidoreductase [Legionella sainthelensi]KTD40803.1 oxidoreductase FAD/NAD(P)-binding protein [Legionella parisiensis]OEH45237.1 Na(+)-translocating NADH-quinone reductase subunit F [Legionella parisiensis]PQM71048.1 oxidoreductase [Legionella pneumophila]
MTIYQIKLLDRQIVAEGTMAFIFEKPKDFTFKAGQFGDFTLLNPEETDEEGNTRAFSLTNPPYANDLMVATRMRDTAFKRVLKTLPIGTELKLDAPYGSFTLHNNKAIPAVFLTGGIGITPVRSIVTQATEDKLPHQIYLFYSNNRPEDTAFLEELKSLEKGNSYYKFISTMTVMEKSKQPWTGEKGFINREMLEKYIKDLTTPIYYISGPATMVAAMRKMLNEADINDDNIRTEEFSGY